MFVKIIATVLFFSSISIAQAAEDFQHLHNNTREYLSSLKMEAISIVSLSPEEAPKAIERAERQFRFLEGELQYMRKIATESEKASLARLEITSMETEEALSEALALAIGFGSLKVVLQKMEAEGRIEKVVMTSLPDSNPVHRGGFENYPTNQRLYQSGMGRSSTTRKLCLSFFDKKRNKTIEISAIQGSHLRTIAEVKKLMSAGSFIGDWIQGNFRMVSGTLENSIRGFLLYGQSINFNPMIEANKGWVKSDTFRTYYYGLFFIGEVQHIRCTENLQ